MVANMNRKIFRLSYNNHIFFIMDEEAVPSCSPTVFATVFHARSMESINFNMRA